MLLLSALFSLWDIAPDPRPTPKPVDPVPVQDSPQTLLPDLPFFDTSTLIAAISFLVVIIAAIALLLVIRALKKRS